MFERPVLQDPNQMVCSPETLPFKSFQDVKQHVQPAYGLWLYILQDFLRAPSVTMPGLLPIG